MTKYFFLLLFFSAQAFAAGPQAHLSETGFSFGVVSEGTKVTHEFILENKGDADLIIQKIVPSCGCTAATLTSNTIKPKESEKVSVSFDTSGFKGDKTRTVELLTNDPEHQQLTITMKGAILPGATVSPVRLDFGEISPGSGDAAWKKDLEIKVTSGSEHTISTVSSPSKFITLQEVSSSPDRKHLQYMVSLDKAAPKGEIRDRVIIELSGTHASNINVPILGFLKGDMRVSPGTVSFGVVNPNSVLERTVKIENKSDTPVQILKAESDSDALKLDVLPGENKKKFVLRIVALPSKIHNDLRATVKITTDHPDEKELLLNVYAAVPLR